MTSPHELVGSVITRLNSNLVDEYGGTRIGSYVFGPEQELIFNKYMPKFQVKFTTESTNDRTFGTSFLKTKPTTLDIWAFTKRGDIGSYTGLKNINLILELLDQVETSLGSYTMSRFSLTNIGDTDEVDYNAESSFYYGRKQFIYKRRE